eukprot:GILJ01038917.1.p1 GENE.GILJ01038917.1~~GILJ01038917.1.p1  ORF type:complete len:126 (-),score=6.26 GILJ01038917.1:239-616(-)
MHLRASQGNGPQLSGRQIERRFWRRMEGLFGLVFVKKVCIIYLDCEVVQSHVNNSLKSDSLEVSEDIGSIQTNLLESKGLVESRATFIVSYVDESKYGQTRDLSLGDPGINTYLDVIKRRKIGIV